MDLDLGPEIARFRAELRDWIAAEAPDGLAGLADWTMAPTGGGYRSADLVDAMEQPAYAAWERTLAAARLICPQWPQEYGGQGMDAVRVAVLNEEFHRAGLPRVFTAARSLPWPGSEKPWQYTSAPETIRGRKCARCSGVPCTSTDGPTSASPMPR